MRAGKFSKQINKFNIKRAVEDIISIQSYQAESKNIKLEPSFVGFPVKVDRGSALSLDDLNLVIESDEKRIKQVLMNL